jgi:hypothetical protein
MADFSLQTKQVSELAVVLFRQTARKFFPLRLSPNITIELLIDLAFHIPIKVLIYHSITSLQSE